ncbi:MAG: hypothetical protein ABJN69_05495 [Hellea sp.]
MVMRGLSQSTQGNGHWKGILLMTFLVFISILNVNFLGRSFSLICLPVIGICLWPRTDGAIVSILAILIFGLLLDLLSAGPLGLWALIFLSIFAIFRPHMRMKSHTFGSAFGQWLLALSFAVIASYFLGWFARQSRPDFMPLLYQAVAATVLFPAIYALRHLGKNLLSDADMRGA